jgi:KUP system potassium uptake protein
VHAPANPTGRRLALLSLTARGVVYGDIGTSPLYAIKECFSGPHGVEPTQANVYGVLSLILWALTLVITGKYVTFILRADNRGEGGTFALLALILQRAHRADEQRRRNVLIALAIFGAALLYGDGIITPAISVLSAVEGLKLVTPTLTRFIIPLAVAIISGLFFAQKFGTDKVGKAFGPIMSVYFVAIAALGIRGIFMEPHILQAVNPLFGVRFFLANGFHAFVILGTVVLVVTGGEALYADMGHFGKRPIRLAWLFMVFPCLLLNYFGQGALLLRDPAAGVNPFYLLAPRAMLVPLVIVATLAAIVASQAMISGAFSLTQQSVQLGYNPRVTIQFTSQEHAGQIYIPEINKLLWLGCILIVLFFQTSSALGAAYGIAVTGTMTITSVLFFQISRHRWNWPLWKALGLTLFFLTIDLGFLSSNLLKVAQGGWVPLVIAAGIFTLLTTWKRGRSLLRELLAKGSLPLDLFLGDVERRKPARVSGTAVFMTSDAEGAPVVLLHHLKHNKVLHQKVILLSISTAEVPDVDEEELLVIEELGQGFFRVRATYGFMETPNVPDILKFCNARGLRTKPQETSFYLGRERLLPTGPSRMTRWRKKLFVFMSRNARSATEFFGLPPNRVVELGTQIEF